jgi:hypothetical protein
MSASAGKFSDRTNAAVLFTLTSTWNINFFELYARQRDSSPAEG